MSRNYVRADSQVYNSNETNGNVRKLADCIDTTTNEVKVTFAGAEPGGHGIATAANQETVINASLRDINNTGAIGDGSSQHSSMCLGYDRSNGQGRSLLVDANGTLETNVNMNTGHGLATEAKQDDLINATNRAINNTGSIGDGSTNATVVALGYDRSNGKGRSLLVDADGHLQCDVVSGAITETNSAAILADTASLDTKITACNTGAVVVASGAITETNSAAILADTASLDTKITACNTGAVVVASGAITETNSAAILADTASLDTKITACNTGAVVVASGAITETNSTAILADTASLDGKITACNTGAVVVASGAITETNSTAILADTASLDGKITACNTGAVVVASGAITETNSADILADTTSIDGKITACNTGAVVVASGAITETNSAAILADTASLDTKITACNTGAVVVASGAITETNSTAILADTASLDTKITACNTGAVVVASGAITETNSTAILADTASLDTKIVTSAPITSDGTTTAQAVNVMGSADGTNFRTVKTGTGGEVVTEVDHSWDITNILINNVNVAAGGQQISAEFDLGANVSHEIGRIEVFVDNSAGVTLEVIGAARHTSSGTDYFPHLAPSVSSTEESFTFSQDDVGLSMGHRFMVFQVENKDGSNSTDVTLRVAYYK